MSAAHTRCYPRLLLILAAMSVVPCAFADILWTNTLPTQNLNNAAGASRSNVAPEYGSLCDGNTGNCDSGQGPVTGATNPYILGDQFVLTATNNTITSVTVYEVGNTPTSGVVDNPTDEFNSLTLYIGADQTPLTSITSSYTFQPVQYNGTTNYESVNVSGTYYPVFAITFSGLSLDLGPGEYDFAIGADPKADNIFALHMSDPNLSGGEEDSAGLSPNNGYLYFFDEGSGPLATYQYGPGFISGYDNGADANVIIEGTATPEPSTLALLGLGLLGLFSVSRFRRNTRLV